jgi:hypothetical protein
MTDTENRLRDYLQAGAATVPDSAEPPQLTEPSAHRRHWPVVLAAAAVAVLLVIAIPLVVRFGGKQDPPPAAKPSAALGIPFVTQAKGGKPILHDGKQTVPALSGGVSYVGRVGGGWLTSRIDRPSGTIRAGLLMPDGSFTPLGPPNSESAVPSPDRTRIATTAPLGYGKSRVVVIDVATRKEVASLTLPHQTTIVSGWNEDGIWLAENFKVDDGPPTVWKPGTGRPIQLSIAGFTTLLKALGGTDKVVVATLAADYKSACIEVGSLQNGKFAITRQYCAKGGQTKYPVLSPDGRTVIYPETKLAIDVATGRTTELQVSGGLSGVDDLVFEDDTHVIALPFAIPDPNARRGVPTPRPDSREELTKAQPVYRCDVTSGVCELVLTSPAGSLFKLHQP